MKFNHVPTPELEQPEVVYSDIGRFYVVGGMKLPSVTTVLGAYPKPELLEWRERIGEEEAKKIMNQASIRGECVHTICEKYLNNDPDHALGQMPGNVETFRFIKKVIDENINNIHYQEAPLYSKFLRTAGRVDCIAEWQGKLSIIDFKTSRNRKRKSWIENYFMQTSAYAVMHEELLGKPISQVVIIIALDEEPETQVFVEQRDNYIKGFLSVRRRFKEDYGV